MRYKVSKWISKLISKTKKIKNVNMFANKKPTTSSFKKDIKFFWYIFFFEWKEITKNNIDINIEYIK